LQKSLNARALSGNLGIDVQEMGFNKLKSVGLVKKGYKIIYNPS
jgi:hypothetical protein